MPTFAQMVDEVRSNLAGYTLRQDRITNLANVVELTLLSLMSRLVPQIILLKVLLKLTMNLCGVGIF